jgi:hypothetical protein
VHVVQFLEARFSEQRLRQSGKMGISGEFRSWLSSLSIPLPAPARVPTLLTAPAVSMLNGENLSVGGFHYVSIKETLSPRNSPA